VLRKFSLSRCCSLSGAAGEGRVTCPTRSRLKSARERRREALEALCRASPGLPHPSLGNGEERRVKRPGGLPGSSPPARGSLAGDVSAERAARAELARAAGRVRAGVTRTRPREDRREEVRITVLRHGRDSRARRRVLSRRRRQRGPRGDKKKGPVLPGPSPCHALPNHAAVPCHVGVEGAERLGAGHWALTRRCWPLVADRFGC